jgi:signal peptidase II
VRVLFLAGAVVLVDQATKLLVKGLEIPWLGIRWQGMALGTSKPVLGDFLRLTYIENPGMAFGIDLGGKLFFSLFSFVASVGILYYLYRAKSERLGFRVALALVLGGAVGNLIDRFFYGVLYREGPFFYGKVVDFVDVDVLDVTIFNYHLSRWPVFNVADASVTVGVLLLLAYHRSLQRSPADLLAPGDSVAPVVESDVSPSTEPLRRGDPSAGATENIR